jgi:hypothetical protein
LQGDVDAFKLDSPTAAVSRACFFDTTLGALLTLVTEMFFSAAYRHAGEARRSRLMRRK